MCSLFFYVFPDSVSIATYTFIHPSDFTLTFVYWAVHSSQPLKLLFYGISALSEYILWIDVWPPDVLSYLFFSSHMAQDLCGCAYPAFRGSSKHIFFSLLHIQTMHNGISVNMKTNADERRLYVQDNALLLSNTSEDMQRSPLPLKSCTSRKL